MEETERYGIELEAETSNFKKQMQDIINITKKTAGTIKNNLNVSDAITFRDFETKIGAYNKQIKDLTKELDGLLIKQRNDEWGGKNNTFNAEIEETKNKIEMLGNSIDKLNTKKIEILNYDQTTQYIDELEDKIKELKAELQEKEKASIWNVEQGEIEALKESIRQTSVELDLARDHFSKLEDININGITEDLEEANGELSKFSIFIAEIKNGMSDLGNKISQGFNKTIKNIKRMTLSLVGVHSAYFLISKAVSAYSQYDIEYTKKMKSAWASLGAFLAPLTSMLGTLMQKLVGYFNVFVKALTGVDYIAKANEAYKYTKALKDQNKALTAMDEITNISDNKEDEDFNPFEAIQNVELNPKWVKVMEDLGKKLQPVYNAIKDIIDWSIKHPDVILKIIGGLVVLSTISKILGFFNGVGSAVGLLGLLGVLGAIVAIGAIVLDITVGPQFRETKKLWDDLYDKWVKLTEASKTIKQANEDWAKSVNKIGKEEEKRITSDNKKAQKEIDRMKEIRDEMDSWSPLRWTIAQLNGEYKTLSEEYYNASKNAEAYSQTSKTLYERGKLNKGQIKDYKKILEGYSTQLERANYDQEKSTETMRLGKQKNDELRDSYKKSTETISKMNGEVKKLPNNKKVKIDVDTKDAVKMLGGLNQILAKIKPNWVIGGFNNWINKLASYDVGTPYVPEDQIAMVHKGERIIPAKYNNENLFNNSSNETTNALLIELIQAVEENSNKVPVFNINGKEFAKATYNDYKNESNRLNTNTIMRRV